MGDKGDRVEVVSIKGRQFVLFDGYIAVPAVILREMFLRGYATWRKRDLTGAKPK